MTIRHVVSVLGVAGALVAGGLAPSVAEAGGPDLVARLAKRKAGPYPVEFSTNIKPGKTKDMYLRVKNKTDAKATALELTQYNAEVGWNTKYFRGTDNITGAVRLNGYSFNIPAGKARTFRLRTKAPHAPDATCVTSVISSLDLASAYATAFVNNVFGCPVPPS